MHVSVFFFVFVVAYALLFGILLGLRLRILGFLAEARDEQLAEMDRRTRIIRAVNSRIVDDYRGIVGCEISSETTAKAKEAEG